MIRRQMHPWTVRILVLLVLATSSSCAALRRPEPFVDRSQDARIQQEVEARIQREPSIESGTVRVEVDGALVVLHGSVRGLAAWQCAIRTAQLVAGVSSVVDYLVIEPGPRAVTCLASGPVASRR